MRKTNLGVCLATWVATSLAAGAANVITNGSFETTEGPSAVGWVNAQTATGGALGANDGLNRTFTGDDSTFVYQVTPVTVTGIGQTFVLDFYGNSGVAGRGWIGEVFWTTDGGTTRTPFEGSAITLTMDGNGAAWEQANPGAVSYALTSDDVTAAGVGASLGVQFVGTPGSTFKGLDSVSLDVNPVPEPSAAALLGLAGLAFVTRRRR
jgi:hypothetical protein